MPLLLFLLGWFELRLVKSFTKSGAVWEKYVKNFAMFGKLENEIIQ